MLAPVLLFAALWLAWGVAQAEVPAQYQVLRSGIDVQTVDAPVQVLVEPVGAPLELTDVLHPSRREAWQTVPNGHINLPMVMQPLWVRLTVRNESRREAWIAAIDWPLLLDARLYMRRSASDSWQAVERAALSPADPGAWFAIDLPPAQNAELLFRVATSATSIVPLDFRTPEALQAGRRSHAALMGMLFGALLVMLAYNACLAWFTTDHRYVDYTVYLLSVVLYELAATGYGPALLWPGSPWLAANGYAVFGCLSFLAATWFFRRVLDLASTPLRHIRWMNNGFLVFWIVTGLLAAILRSPAVHGAILVAGGLSGAIAIYSCVRLGRAGNPAAWIFAVAWGTLVVGTAATLLAQAGLLPAEGPAAYGQHVGFVVETVLLSVALAQRIQRARRERQALSRSLETEREQKLLAQAETLALQRHANDVLEQRVVDRTEALAQAMRDLETANAELAELSVTDGLTQLHNRRHLDEVLARETARPPTPHPPIALLLIDIDHFKRINDRHGHIVGDQCLRSVAATLREQINRSTDLVARYGGEEFAVVLPATEATEAVRVAERLRRAIKSRPVLHGDEQIPLTVSIGVASRGTDHTASEWLGHVDQALYAAKKRGRDQVVNAETLQVTLPSGAERDPPTTLSAT